MKKVLVTGASGSIGINVIKYLLSEGKYEITALDLKNNKTIKRLKKYCNRINIIYGDITDELLISSLVKTHDYIIHLASVIPPFSELSNNIGKFIDYEGTENIINSINNYNKNCHLVYASTTSLYDESLNANTKEVIKEDNLNNFGYYKYLTENLIKEKLKNYTILRVPLVLSNLKDEVFIYSVKSNLYVEVTTSFDAAYAFVKSLNYLDVLNKKTFNIGMGQKGVCLYNDILNNILKNYGFNYKYFLSRLLLEKNYVSPILTDSDELEEIIHYRTDSLIKYYKRLKNKSKKRIIQKTLGRIIVFLKRG